MTTSRTPDRFRTELEDIGDTISKLKKLYPAAFGFSLAARQSRGMERGRSTDVSDPTWQAYQQGKWVRDVLKEVNGKVDAVNELLNKALRQLDSVQEGPKPETPTRWMCKRCERNEVKARGLCGACLEYERRTGRERPERLVQNG